MHRYSMVAWFVLMAPALDTGSRAQAQSLGDVVTETQTEWLIGSWVEKGNSTTTVSFEWQLDHHAIAVQFNSNSVKVRGIIAFRAHDNEVLYFAADNQGATGQGKWGLNDGHPTLRYNHVSKNGKKTDAGFVHKAIDDNTMVIEVYELSGDGEITGEPLSKPKFVRK